jgi:ATP-dependent DNA helicase RecQ
MHSEKIHSILKETFGYQSFRFEQLNIINSILGGRDTLAIMPTGGGKSLCYQIPALYLEGVTLVISPLISLMHDQVMNLKEYGVKSLFLNSSLSQREASAARSEILKGEVKIVYMSPEGILSPFVREFFGKVKISLVAIDEVHCVSQWGHEFRKDYTRLGELKDMFPGVPLLALTATADAKTRADISKQLRLNDPNIFISSFDRPNIRYLILERADEMKQLHEFIQAHHIADTGIVYCLSRDKVERVTENLVKLGYPAVSYHAGMSSEERSRSQTKFNQEERIIVVATIAFGMGIDRPDVRFVAHLDLPKSIESYYQETGRAGRDGKPSSAWMIYGLQDVVKLSQMLENTDAEENYKKVARHKLDCMLALCEAASCRRRHLLSYFGQESGATCGNCDACLEPPVLWDATIDAQKVLSTIYRTQQMFGAGHVIDVIRGAKTAKVTDRQHDTLSVYGIGKDQPKEHWNSLLRQLLNLNFIEIKSWEYRSLGLTAKAGDILKGGSRLELRKQNYSEKSSKNSRSSKKGSVSIAVKGEEGLFGALKALRNTIAREKGLPSYVVFNDKSLHDMCALKPRTEDEFLMVYGVGQNKLENYGAQFMQVIREH